MFCLLSVHVCIVSENHFHIIQENNFLCYQASITYYNTHMATDTVAVIILVHFIDCLELLEYFILHPLSLFFCSRKTIAGFLSFSFFLNTSQFLRNKKGKRETHYLAILPYETNLNLPRL